MGLFPKDRNLAESPDRVELNVDASFFRIRPEELHMRLDHFLGAHLKWRSRSSLRQLIKDGHVLVDPATPNAPHGSGTAHVELRPGRKLHHGSGVIVLIPEELRLQAHAADSDDLVILYEDAEVVAVDKPPFLAVHPSGRHLTGTLIQRVHEHYLGEIEDGRLVPRLCHRLDRETSGIVLIGKNPRTHAKVMKQFERRKVEKDYLVIVQGEPEAQEGTVDLPLGPSRNSSIRLKIAAIADGLPSRTDWRVVERHPGYALLACRLITGRQHQIRVHLAAIGHPVVGDKLYGPDEQLFIRAVGAQLDEDDRQQLELPRHALHNHRLVFTTPDGGGRVEVVSPLASDLREFLDGIQSR
jgi:23S rRNA pseudouridine1911/1915/1917 synthase